MGGAPGAPRALCTVCTVTMSAHVNQLLNEHLFYGNVLYCSVFSRMPDDPDPHRLVYFHSGPHLLGGPRMCGERLKRQQGLAWRVE